MARYAHTEAEGDPSAVPIRPAATVMVVADRPDLEVLMVQRTSRLAFGASAWVFPGGRVDPEDGTDVSDLVSGLDDQQASRLLDVPSGGLAWWLAAIRETVEEAGVLLSPSTVGSTAIDSIRAAAHADYATFVRSLSAHRVSLDLSGIVEVGRFITPVGPPRRFDTRFFVARAPAVQEISPDRNEVIDARWIRPRDAVALWHAEEFPLMSVTHRMLSCLGRYESSHDLIEHARTRPEAQRVRVHDPEGAYEVLLPGEPGYEDAELEIEHGWVRL